MLTVSLFFSSFKTEEDNDILKVYDLTTQELLGEFSGEDAHMVTSLSGQMFLTFSTNSSITDEGWEAYYYADWVGVEETPMNLEVKVFPVPVKEQLNISLKNSHTDWLKLDLISVNGKTILSEEFHSIRNENLFTINTGDVPDGIYILRINTGEETQFKKIVIQQ